MRRIKLYAATMDLLATTEEYISSCFSLRSSKTITDLYVCLIKNQLQDVHTIPTTEVVCANVKIIDNGGELFDGGLQVFDDAHDKHIGWRQAIGVFQAFVA